MDNEKLTSIQQYLAGIFSDQEIEQNYDFDRGTQHFKIITPEGPLHLKITEEFIADHDIPEIIRRLNRWAVADALRESKHMKYGVLVSESGLRQFSRS
jgi:hypothetical protein